FSRRAFARPLLLPSFPTRRSSDLQLDAVAHEARGAGADEDLAGLGLLLQAGGEVDGLARRECRLRLVLRHDLAGLDPDARLEAELPHALERRERGPDGALGGGLLCPRPA